MFKSIRRPMIIPQSEHLRLAGTLAFLWGNDEFEVPPLPRLSVVTGIALHDRAYGYMDNIPIGDTDDAEWLAVTRRGFYMPCADPVADVITRQHLLRLVGWRDTPARQVLAEEMRGVIAKQIEQNGWNAELFARIDRMTKLCDNIAFGFCREEDADGRVEVVARYARGETRAVHYRIRASEITLDPWPLNVDSYEGYLVGYRAEGYPEQADGVLIPFSIRAA